MLGWLWRLIVGRFGWCMHVYSEKPWAHAKLFDPADEGKKDALAVQSIVVVRCTKCGDLKQHRIF